MSCAVQLGMKCIISSFKNNYTSLGKLNISAVAALLYMFIVLATGTFAHHYILCIVLALGT